MSSGQHVEEARPVAPAATIPPSCLHAVFRAAEERERRTGVPVTKLHVGEPYFAPPAAAVEALVAAVRDGHTTYTSAEGMATLREALTAKLEQRNGHRTAPDRVFVTPGSCQGLAAVMQSFAQPGDQLLLPSLHWPIHLQQCLLAGLEPVFYPLDASYRPDPEGLEAVASPRVRALLVNTPANPTGAVVPPARLRALLELAHARGWAVISDEAYEDFAFDGEHTSLAAMERDLPERERLVYSSYSFSKSYAMTGFRLGYVVAPHADAAAALRVVQEASIVGPSTPVQHAGLATLGEHREARRNAALVRDNRDRALPRLARAGLLADLPEGGWYALLDVRATGADAEGFAAGLLETRDVALAPGQGFALRPETDAAGRVRAAPPSPAARTLLRLAFCGDPQALDTGVDEVVAFAAGLRSGG